MEAPAESGQGARERRRAEFWDGLVSERTSIMRTDSSFFFSPQIHLVCGASFPVKQKRRHPAALIRDRVT